MYFNANSCCLRVLSLLSANCISSISLKVICKALIKLRKSLNIVLVSTFLLSGSAWFSQSLRYRSNQLKASLYKKAAAQHTLSLLNGSNAILYLIYNSAYIIKALSFPRSLLKLSGFWTLSVLLPGLVISSP